MVLGWVGGLGRRGEWGGLQIQEAENAWKKSILLELCISLLCTPTTGKLVRTIHLLQDLLLCNNFDKE